MKIYKTIIILTTLVTPMLAIDLYEELDETDLNAKHIYLTNPDMVKDMETITYMVGIENDQIRDIFINFANNLGKNNGAIDLINPSKKYDSYMRESSCFSISSAEKFILFEDVSTNRCITILITDKNQILNALIEIEKVIDNEKNLSKFELKSKLDNFIKSSEFNKNMQDSLMDLVSYLLS